MTAATRPQWPSSGTASCDMCTKPRIATLCPSNGDLLYANGSGTSQLVAPGRVAFQATVMFEGGTGRFASASGTATITGEADLANARSSFTTTGTISY